MLLRGEGRIARMIKSKYPKRPSRQRASCWAAARRSQLLARTHTLSLSLSPCRPVYALGTVPFLAFLTMRCHVELSENAGICNPSKPAKSLCQPVKCTWTGDERKAVSRGRKPWKKQRTRATSEVIRSRINRSIACSPTPDLLFHFPFAPHNDPQPSPEHSCHDSGSKVRLTAAKLVAWHN